MCGITGFVTPGKVKPSLNLLRRMTEAIAYRGPDDQGLEIIDNCGLGNRRLAVVDLSSRAHQPMWDKQKRFCLTYNGEVYNFKVLKKQLLKKGYRFFSESDTEVILNLFKEYGPSAFSKMSGMFALAIWDKKKRVLFLARDHFGIKPLYYYFKSGYLVFGSEIKSILISPQVKKELSLQALSSYFSIGFGAIPSPCSIFENIYKLPSASWAVFDGQKLVVKKYWHLEKVKPSVLSFPKASQRLLFLLEQSVKDQMVSDVPLGGFLSGGIDSSTIVALMAKSHPSSIKTFSINFKDPDFDESKYSEKVSQYLGTEHFAQTFTAEKVLKVLPEAMSKLDEPMADASLLPTFLLSKFARQRVTVALSGDGGDELFAGYPTYFAHQAASLFALLPSCWLRAALPLALKIAPVLPVMKHSRNLASSFKIKRFLFGVNQNLGRQYLNFMGPIGLEVKPNIFSESVKEKLGVGDWALGHVEDLLKEVNSYDRQKKLQYLDLKLYLGEDGLTKTDRASSFNSLEVRVPFLTPEIAELAFSLPSSYHLNGLTLKRLLKEAAKDLLPPEIINRPKKGFGVPISQWLKKDLRPLTDRLLAERRLKKQELFNPIFIERLIKEHRSGKESHQMILWPLLVFQLWYDRWL